MIYVKINLNNGGTYTQPLNEVGVVLDEIKWAAEEGALDSVWTISLVEMSEEEYAKLPEFTGH